jgi:hypothetical protein
VALGQSPVMPFTWRYRKPHIARADQALRALKNRISVRGSLTR